MQHIFIGRESELLQVEKLFNAKNGGVISLQGKSGIGKSYLLRNIRNKYFLHPQFFLDCNDLPLIETASEFLLHLSKQNTGLKNINDAGKIIEKNKKSQHQISNVEQILLEALTKDCKQRPIIFVDAYEHLLTESQVFIHRIECDYSRLHKQHGVHQESLLYTEWLKRLLQFFKSQGALLIIAGTELDSWLENIQLLDNFDEADILNYAATMRLENAIAENRVTVATILSKLSFGGNPLWLSLACHFLVSELACGKELIQLGQINSLEDYLSIPQADRNYQDMDKDDICKLFLFERVMPPHKENSWLIALPRYLDNETLICLFGNQGDMLFHALKTFGLLYQSSIDKKYLKLHDEIKTILLNYAKQQNLLDSFESKKKHQSLVVLYKEREQGKQKNNLSLVNQLYHQLMAGNSAEIELENVEDSQLLVALAVALQHTEEYSIMTQVFFRLITITPNHNEAWHSLGVTLSKQGRYKEAIATFQKQLILNPEHDTAWKNMGYAFYLMGNVEQAVIAYQKKRSILSKNRKAWEKIITELYKQNDLQNIINQYKQKILKCPDHETAHYNLGINLKKLGLLEKSIEAFRQQLMINPLHDRAWNNMGTTFFHQGKYEDAQNAFSKALEIDSNYLFTLCNDAELALVQNQGERFLKRADKVLNLVDNSSEETVMIAFLIWLNSNNESYQPILEAIDKRQPENYFHWDFDAIELVIQKLRKSQQKIAYCFIGYFKQCLSFPALQSRLKDD